MTASSCFKHTKQQFYLPEDLVYLDGNSLGPLPLAATEKVSATLQKEWGELLIQGWNKAGWMAAPSKTGDRLATMLGAPAGSIVMGDTLSIKVFQAVDAAMDLVPDRAVVLSDSGNFPTDLYMVEGLLKNRSAGELKVVEPEHLASAIDPSVAVVLLTGVDYRTGRLHDTASIVKKAHAVGATVVLDLAHSAGAIPVNLHDENPDFAVGCTYKYLNGGPGAPAFIYVAPRHQQRIRPALSGWLGHAAPFAFDQHYTPADGVERMRVGTPPVVALSILDAALDIWEQVSMDAVRQASIKLSEQFIAGVESQCPELVLASPRDAQQRGSQVSFRHPEGYAIVQALISAGVVGDFRAPDILRFGFTPLYLDSDDVAKAVERLALIMREGRWDQPHFKIKAAVT